ncbi:MAG: hypothetical protein OXC54_02345 [Rhodospirillaceae bacterium]|nr:hypothetical protein [Rhodospirillaceae bacterium]
MIRLTTIIWLVLLGSVTGALFVVKHEVRDLERQVMQTEEAIKNYRRGIRVLQAEWSLLTSPQFLLRHPMPDQLAPLTGDQFRRFAELPETFAAQFAVKEEGRAPEQSAGAAGALFRNR